MTGWYLWFSSQTYTKTMRSKSNLLKDAYFFSTFPFRKSCLMVIKIYARTLLSRSWRTISKKCPRHHSSMWYSCLFCWVSYKTCMDFKRLVLLWLQDCWDASRCGPSGPSSLLSGTFWRWYKTGGVYGKHLQTRYQVLQCTVSLLFTTSHGKAKTFPAFFSCNTLTFCFPDFFLYLRCVT